MSADDSRTQYKAIMAQREAKIREDWVKTMEARITRDVLVECQQTEGVNAWEKCKDIADRYTNMLADAKVKGYRIIDLK